LAKLKTSTARKKKYWKEKKANQKLTNAERVAKMTRNLRHWLSHSLGTAYRDGKATRQKKGWYITKAKWEANNA